MSTAAPPPHRPRAERWAEHPWVKLGVAAATIIAGVAGVVALLVPLRSGSATAPPPASAAASPASVQPATPAPAGPASSGAAATVSRCLDDTYAPVDCRAPHRLEQVDGPCTIEGMLSYMSGRPGTDVVLTTVRPWSGGCVLESPVEVAETAAAALAGGNDDAWRRCLDDRQGRLVPCSQEHTGEYLATGSPRKASPAECTTAAEAYLGQTLDEVGDLLTVRVVAEEDPDPNAPRCLIAVRGSQPLTASVRNLGVNPVPLRR